VSGVDEVELGYSLMPQYWGKGLATEMATAMLAVGFDHLGLPSVIAMTYAGNGRSRRVAEKLGFQFERETAWKGSQAMLYRKTPERLPKHDL
jgi:RimJ/RimL family protein N-acetyltransferase